MGEDNGQVTIIGGSELFHGAPLFGVQIASRIVDMVFFTSPQDPLSDVAARMKSELLSFIWVPWIEVSQYIEKSDAVLIGPGFMRYKSEVTPHGHRFDICDEACQLTRQITQKLLSEFPSKKWVIDAGSLQTMDPKWIPEDAILTPNKKEYSILFGDMDPQRAAKAYRCIIVQKGPVSYVYSPDSACEVKGGNPGLTKGGTGDVLAGLTAALLAKNDPFLAACCASFIVKKSAEDLSTSYGIYFNADDLAEQIPQTLSQILSS